MIGNQPTILQNNTMVVPSGLQQTGAEPAANQLAATTGLNPSAQVSQGQIFQSLLTVLQQLVQTFMGFEQPQAVPQQPLVPEQDSQIQATLTQLTQIEPESPQAQRLQQQLVLLAEPYGREGTMFIKQTFIENARASLERQAGSLIAISNTLEPESLENMSIQNRLASIEHLDFQLEQQLNAANRQRSTVAYEESLVAQLPASPQKQSIIQLLETLDDTPINNPQRGQFIGVLQQQVSSLGPDVAQQFQPVITIETVHHLDMQEEARAQQLESVLTALFHMSLNVESESPQTQALQQRMAMVQMLLDQGPPSELVAHRQQLIATLPNEIAGVFQPL